MRVCYSIRDLRLGTGQTLGLFDIIRSGHDKWQSTIITAAVYDGADSAVPINCELIRAPYYTAPINRSIRAAFRASDIIHIRSGLTFLPATIGSDAHVVYTLMQPDPWRIFSGRSRFSVALTRVLEPLLIRPAPVTFLSISKWVAEWYLKKYGIASQVIPEPVDFSVFFPSVERPNLHRRPSLLTIGGWDGIHGRKHTHELIEALPEIRAAYPDVELTLVGFHPTASEALSQIARELKVVDSLRVVGMVDTSNLAQEFRRADALLVSTISEGFYRPVIESFACGLPAVVRDSRGLVPRPCQAATLHAIESGAAALYDGSPQSLLEGIGRVLVSRVRLAAAGLKYAARFDSTSVLPRYEQLYLNAPSHKG